MRDENEVEKVADRASKALSNPDDSNHPSEGWYSKDYLEGVRDALDWVTEFADEEPIRAREKGKKR